MSVLFLDSSALVKRYVSEAGSEWVKSLVVPSAGNVVMIARVTWVEVLSALARRRREADLTAKFIVYQLSISGSTAEAGTMITAKVSPIALNTSRA